MSSALSSPDVRSANADSDSSKPSVCVLLLGNYEHDRQESMQRFARLLREEMPRHAIATDFIRPEPWLGRLKPSPWGFGKWLGYFDKFVLFPIALRRRIAALRQQWGALPFVVHICDHSNSFYEAVTGAPTLVTCHDLLAVRGALGEDTDCPASRFGRLFQRMILRGLIRTDFVVCDSAATRTDLLHLGGSQMGPKSGVVLLAQNHPYRRLSPEETAQRLANIPRFDPQVPYLINVGLNLMRKNRRGILRIFSQMKSQWPGKVVFAGEPLDDESRGLAKSLGVDQDIVEIVKPSNSVLEALYNQAFALIYPSKCEGFGWPIIEAQACGCPVVCSDRTSVPEVGGEGSIVCPLEDESAFATALLSLRDAATREALVARGFENLKRFRTEVMVEKYRDFYLQLASRSGHASVRTTTSENL